MKITTSPKVNSKHRQSGMSIPAFFRHVNKRRGREFPEKPGHLHVLSLGAGVQSTTLALMAIRGEIEAPDVAIFADTQWEPAGVYRHLEWLDREMFTAGIPLIVASRGSLREALMTSRAEGRFVSHPPLFTLREVPVHKPVSKFEQQSLVDVESSKDPLPTMVYTIGALKRGCTRDFKIRVVEAVERSLLGRKRMPSDQVLVTQNIGLSTDELTRMKENPQKWAWNRFPLVELGMSRASCEKWLSNHGYRIPEKSACIGCPYHDNRYWRRLRRDPEAWADAVEVDRKIREGLHAHKMEVNLFLHRSCTPLEEAVFDDGQGNLFEEECDGVCGV